MKRKILALICAVIFSVIGVVSLFSVTTLSIFADDINKISVQADTDVVQGKTYTAKFYIDNLTNVASLNVTVHYDPNIISVNSTNNVVSCLLHDKTISDNSVSYTYIFGESTDENVHLFDISYSIKNDASLGSSFFDVVVNEAFDAELNSVTVSGTRLSFNVTANKPSYKCFLYPNVNNLSSTIGEEFEITYLTSNTQIAAGTIEIQYDRDLFEFISFTPELFLSNKTVEVNSDLIGSVMVSFAGTEYYSSNYMFKIKFRTIGNANTVSTISILGSSLYNLDLNYVNSTSNNTNVALSYNSSFDDSIAKMYVTAEYDRINKQVIVLAKLSENSNLGAGDFSILWNNTLLEYQSYSKEFSPSYFNVNTKQVDEGVLNFSIVSLSDVVDETDVIRIVLDVIGEPHSNLLCDIQITGSGFTDSLTLPVDLNLSDCNLEVPAGFAKIKSASLTVSSDLSINYYCELEGIYTNAKMRFTRNGNVTILNGEYCTSGSHAGKYVYHYTGVSAQYMADNIKAEIIWGNDDIVLDTVENYSVQQYCVNMHNKNSGNTALMRMLADMLEYGAAAQIYTNYNTGNLANNLDWISSFKTNTYVRPETDKSATTASGYDSIKSAGLSLNYTGHIFFKVRVEDTNNKTVVLKKSGVEIGVFDVVNLEYLGDNLYYMRTNDISALQFDDVFTLILKDGDTELHRVNYSVRSYANSKFNDSNVNLDAMIKTLYAYGSSAKAYANQ